MTAPTPAEWAPWMCTNPHHAHHPTTADVKAGIAATRDADQKDREAKALGRKV